MTLRKLILLFEEYQKEHGQYKRPETIEDLMPEGGF